MLRDDVIWLHYSWQLILTSSTRDWIGVLFCSHVSPTPMKARFMVSVKRHKLTDKQAWMKFQHGWRAFDCSWINTKLRFFDFPLLVAYSKFQPAVFISYHIISVFSDQDLSVHLNGSVSICSHVTITAKSCFTALRQTCFAVYLLHCNPSLTSNLSDISTAAWSWHRCSDCVLCREAGALLAEDSGVHSVPIVRSYLPVYMILRLHRSDNNVTHH